MNECSRLVLDMYEHCGKWQRVANICNRKSGHTHSAGYYQLIAIGSIQNPHAETVAAIRLASAEMALKSPRQRAATGVVVVGRKTWLRLRSMKIARGGVTWDALLDRAATLLEEEVTE